MSGKPYSIKEFKIIVDYLVENKLYGETKARKMWVDFANTKLTSRTWQSLKETFLKRILPDIHNPYFKLNNEQISSFRARCDLEDRNKNKLDIQTISDESNSNGHDLKDNEPANNEGETTAGENKKSSKVPVRSRSSADTIILENCYETAEEIRKELEATESDEKPTAASKSLRDCITYSEPLTPMLQEVLDDFASEPEDSDREGQMEIVEIVPETDNSENIQENPEPENNINNTKTIATDVANNAKRLSTEVVEEVLAQELDCGDTPENKSPEKNAPNLTEEVEDLPDVNLYDEISSTHAENGTDKEDDAVADTEVAENLIMVEDSEISNIQHTENSDVIVVHDSHSEPREQSSGVNNSNSTVDASLPNNPEGFKNKNTENVESKDKDAPESVTEGTNKAVKTLSLKKTTRKRSCSEDNSNNIDNKKKKVEMNSKSQEKVDKKVKESHLDTNAGDKLTDKEEFIKPDVIKKPWLEENSKPSTSFETHVVDLIETEKTSTKKSNSIESAEAINPCLQNISLFDEQFNKTKYNMSESSDTEQNKKETKAHKQEATGSKTSNDVVVLRSHSDTDSREVQAVTKKKHRTGVLACKSERDKAIANMFGFTSGGGVGLKRKRQLSRRRRTISHNNASQHTAAPASNSSDWTSESGSETFVSPPRCRKNRPSKKYLKPQASKILSLEEEGGLFVMYGKKIYPLVKDGKIVKNYVTYLPESDSEEGESFWKLKYVEEKKKAAELKKLLEEAKEPRKSKDADTSVPQANPLRSSRSSPAREPTNGVVAKETSAPGPDEKKEEAKVIPPEKIKIKFTKNNEEVYLEGHWPQIHPVLEQVVQIFHKEVEQTVSENKPKMSVAQTEQVKELSSGVSTPIITSIPDPEVHEKVNKIEKEIFQEIEERDREEENEPNGQAINVTKRKQGRPRKSSSSSHNSPEKKAKTSNEPEIKDTVENSRTRSHVQSQKGKEIENNNNTQDTAAKRQTRTPRKYMNETVNVNESRTIQTRRSRQMDTSTVNEEDDTRYMLPPRNNKRSLKSPATKRTNQRKR